MRPSRLPECRDLKPDLWDRHGVAILMAILFATLLVIGLVSTPPT